MVVVCVCAVDLAMFFMPYLHGRGEIGADMHATKGDSDKNIDKRKQTLLKLRKKLQLTRRARDAVVFHARPQLASLDLDDGGRRRTR